MESGEITLPFDLPIHPAAPGTRQMLAREQANYKLFLKRHDPSLDFDLATLRKDANILNPGKLPLLSTVHQVLMVEIPRRYGIILDNTSSETILNSKAGLPATAKRITTSAEDVLSLATGHGIVEIPKYVVLGYAFYQRFFMIVDLVKEHKIGFGTTEYTYAELN